MTSDLEQDRQKNEERPEGKPHGAPLTLGGGGYGGSACTDPSSKTEGDCADDAPDAETAEQARETRA